MHRRSRVIYRPNFAALGSKADISHNLPVSTNDAGGVTEHLARSSEEA